MVQRAAVLPPSGKLQWPPVTLMVIWCIVSISMLVNLNGKKTLSVCNLKKILLIKCHRWTGIEWIYKYIILASCSQRQYGSNDMKGSGSGGQAGQ